MRSRSRVRLAPPAVALALLTAGGCTVVDRPSVLTAPAGTTPVAAPVYAGAPPAIADGAPAYAAPAVYGGVGTAVPAGTDPYCREAQQEARAAAREAEMAARDARVSAYAGAPDWVQAQDARRAQSTAAEANRAQRYAARDCR